MTNSSNYSRRPSGRRAGPTATRSEILEAARVLFGERGYDGASLRAIAQKAGVDTALIYHYFRTKEGLFHGAIDDVFGGRSFLDGLSGETDEIAHGLVARYFELWENPESQDALLAILRSAIDNDRARELLLNFISKEIYDVLAPLIPAAEATLRISFIGSQMLGAALLRYVFKIEPLASLPMSSFVDVLAVSVEGYLTHAIADSVILASSASVASTSKSAKPPH